MLSKLYNIFQKHFILTSASFCGVGSFVVASSITQIVSGGRSMLSSSFESDNVVGIWEVNALLLGFGVFLVVFGIFWGVQHVRR